MAAHEIETRNVQAGEHRLLVHTCGDPTSDAIVFLHGSGPGVSALSNWQHLLPRFAESYFCIAPDVLGFGDSDHPDPAPVGMQAYTRLRAATVIAMLDALGVQQAHFVGNSMGGMITLTIAQGAPERINRMILMGSGGAPIPPTPDLMKLITFYDDPSVEAMSALLTAFVDDQALYAGELDAIAADRVARANREDVRRSHLATFNLEGGPVRFSEDELAAIHHETLVLHGREDRMLPVACGYYLAEHLPNAQLHVLPHAGHWIQIEQADRFTDQALVFFAEAATRR